MTTTTTDLYATVAAAADWLNEHNGASREELGLRILKVVEEAGEAAAAWIGTTGQNPRKGITHTTADVAAELADVAFTALVGIASLGHDPATTLHTCAMKVARRIDVSSSAAGVTRRLCAWCHGPIPVSVRPDAVCCSVRCRQEAYGCEDNALQPPR